MKKNTDRSPLAPKSFPELANVEGVEIATASTGIKYKNRDDLLIVKMIEDTSIVGFLTRSSTCSAAVDWCRKNLLSGKARALIVNAGNANAFTGDLGAVSVNECVSALADNFSCRPSRIFVASTGVIGEVLPHKFIISSIPKALKSISSTSVVTWERAAHSILTTDTYPKGSSAQAEIGGVNVSISGIAKGSGMIAPDMATMLAFIFTDAKIPSNILKKIVSPILEKTFNSITVDSDTSTSDTFLVFATGAKGKHPFIKDADAPELQEFKERLEYVMRDLALQIVRDGEGATKFISISVTGASDDLSAKKIGLSIANSPLFKTAISGEDANWGRVVMAIGKSKETINRDLIRILIGGIEVAQKGSVVPGYDVSLLSRYMKSDKISVEVDVGIGIGSATVWTCDLSHGYISINADYRS